MNLKRKKLLVANRGEIAVRVFQGAEELGLIPVALAGPGDEEARHTWYAHEVYPISSYLSIPEIVGICQRNAIDFVHPGYGFLSERAEFIRALDEAGIGFLGPRADSIDALGDKINAKKVAERAQVPTLPWAIVGENADLKALAKKIGFPVLLKAAAGGGGKGMRVCEREEDLASLAESASREAKSSFGDGSLFMEKKLTNPRHIEVQVFGDGKGGGIHLFERDCSLQRRNQKVIEEARAPNLSSQACEKLFTAAMNLVREVKYRSAGTLEFLVDAEENIYFLEMNTRLQVEHTVTECVTGIDLVHAQILLGLDENHFPIEQPTSARGHSIEARVYAEDPKLNFAPTPGPVRFLRWPQGTGIRIESGIEEGLAIPMNYDAMCGKIITTAPTRALAIARMQYALKNTWIGGFKTNIEYLNKLMILPEFVEGRAHIGSLGIHHEKLTQTEFSEDTLALLSRGILAPQELRGGLAQLSTSTEHSPGLAETPSPWNVFRGNS